MLLRIRPAATPSFRSISSGRFSFPISLSKSLSPARVLFPSTSIFKANLFHSTNTNLSGTLSAVHKRYSTTESTTAQLGADTPQESEILFVGTGTSEGIPRVSCLTNPYKTCEVCSKAANPGDKNKRLNTSLLIRYSRPSGYLNILIDAGKFFYHSALRLFPTIGVRNLDAVIITHSHADAIGGLDDLRDWTNNVQHNIPIYVANRDFEVMKKTHYYLVDTSVVTPGAAVSDLQFKIISEESFVVHDIKFTPLPVWHGKDYRSLGFRFGNVCYISDVSEIPEETYPLLKDCELLIMDALRPDRSSATHFGLPRALEEVRKIQPKRTLFTGMMHLMDHEIINEQLLKLKDSEGLDVQLSYDGLRVPLLSKTYIRMLDPRVK